MYSIDRRIRERGIRMGIMERRPPDIITVSGELLIWQTRSTFGYVELSRHGIPELGEVTSKRVYVDENVVRKSGFFLPIYLGTKVACEIIERGNALIATRILSLDERSTVSGKDNINWESSIVDFVSEWEMVHVESVDERNVATARRSKLYSPIYIPDKIARKARKDGAHPGDVFQVRWMHGERATKKAVDARQLWSNVRVKGDRA